MVLLFYSVMMLLYLEIQKCDRQTELILEVLADLKRISFEIPKKCSLSEVSIIVDFKIYTYFLRCALSFLYFKK